MSTLGPVVECPPCQKNRLLTFFILWTLLIYSIIHSFTDHVIVLCPSKGNQDLTSRYGLQCLVDMHMGCTPTQRRRLV